MYWHCPSSVCPSVHCPSLNIHFACRVISLFSVEEFQWNLTQILIVWVGVADTNFKVKGQGHDRLNGIMAEEYISTMWASVLICFRHRVLDSADVAQLFQRTLNLRAYSVWSSNSTGTSFPVTSPLQIRQLVMRKSGVSGVSPACYEEVTTKLATFRPSRHVKMVWRVANFIVTSR